MRNAIRLYKTRDVAKCASDGIWIESDGPTDLHLEL